MVCVEIALLWIEAVLAQGSSSIVVYLVSIIELAGIEHLGAVDGMGHIHALDGTLLILVCLLPRDSLAPVEMRSHRVALLVLLYLVTLVTAIGRISQALADDAVAHPVDKLTILGVAHLVLIHPEAIHTDIPHREFCAP